MREITLTRGHVALVDDADYERVAQFKWQAQPSVGGHLYATRTHWNDDGTSTTVRMHRVILGISDSTTKVDHINHDGLDNRRANSRVCTHTQNMRNMLKRNSKSNYKCVQFEPKKRLWRARISIGTKRIGLGRYKNERDAALAYDRAAIHYFGEFALLNFPEGRV